MKHLVIVDGHHLMYRAYWAIPRTMKNGKGEQVNTAFGMASMLINILRSEKPDALLFCFDADEDTFRHKEYAEYKAGRSATPDDFYTQVPRALELIDSFGIKSVSGGGFEADDFACSYAKEAAKAGYRVTVVSGDRDLLQLATEHVRIAIPHKGYQAAEYLGPAEIRKKYGVTPEQIPSYKGLVGDSSDNLPGVHGIGPKAAEALLQQYGSVANLYEHLSDVKDSWRTKLEVGKEQAFFCERMALLKCDIPLSIPLEELSLESVDLDPVFALFNVLEFTLVTKRLQALMESDYGKGRFTATPDPRLGTVTGKSLETSQKVASAPSEKAKVASSQLSLL